MFTYSYEIFWGSLNICEYDKKCLRWQIKNKTLPGKELSVT